MISAEVKQSFDRAFGKALLGSLILAPGDVCSIVPAADPRLLSAQNGESLFVVTISSFVFRLLTFFQVATSPACLAYYGGSANGRTFQEEFQEVANMCCGALNRELSRHFPHLAMSIPYALSNQCITFLDQLRPQHLSSSAATINNAIRIRVTLCICCSEPIDIPKNVVVAEHETGELELF